MFAQKVHRAEDVTLAAVKNVGGLISQCYEYMAAWGLHCAIITCYLSSWILFADQKGGLLISPAVQHNSRRGPHSVSVTELLVAALHFNRKQKKDPFKVASKAGCEPNKMPPGKERPLPPPPQASSSKDVGSFGPQSLTVGQLIQGSSYMARYGLQAGVARIGTLPSEVQEVQNEVLALGALRHLPAGTVPQILATGRVKPYGMFCVTSFIEGIPFDWHNSDHCRYIPQLRKLYQRLHAQSVTHNDFDGANILITEPDGVSLIDFGGAQVRSSEALCAREMRVFETMVAHATRSYTIGDTANRTEGE